MPATYAQETCTRNLYNHLIQETCMYVGQVPCIQFLHGNCPARDTNRATWLAGELLLFKKLRSTCVKFFVQVSCTSFLSDERVSPALVSGCRHQSNSSADRCSRGCRRVGSEWALDMAKHNLAHNYLVVGTTNQLEEFVAVLEASLPRFFAGALEFFVTGWTFTKLTGRSVHVTLFFSSCSIS